MSCISAHDPQLVRLADAIAQRVGQQRFHVWFNNSTRLDLTQDGLEIAVPNDFISEWIGTHYARSIQEAAHEVLGTPLVVRFQVMPQLFKVEQTTGDSATDANTAATRVAARSALHPVGHSVNGYDEAQRAGGQMMLSPRNGATALKNAAVGTAVRQPMRVMPPAIDPAKSLRHPFGSGTSLGGDAAMEGANRMGSLSLRPRLRHDLASFVVGPSNHLAHSAATSVAELPGAQYNPLFVHGACGLGKTHLLQGICKKFLELQPTKRWLYLTGEEFTNEFLSALRNNKLDLFRRKMRDLDLLVIDDVHFLGGKKATLEEFLHTFNAIEAMGRQVVMASDNHPKMIEEFGESLINRFVSGMVVRIDPPSFATRCEILKSLTLRIGLMMSEEVISWVARRVTQNVRELEGAVTRINAHAKLTGRPADVALQESLGDLDRAMVAPVKPENILGVICVHFGLENKDLMSGRRQRTISLARSIAMFLIRKTAKLSFPEIGIRMGKRNHSTVISACRRIEKAASRNEKLTWTSAVGDRSEEASELLQRLEEQSRAMG